MVTSLARMYHDNNLSYVQTVLKYNGDLHNKIMVPSNDKNSVRFTVDNSTNQFLNLEILLNLAKEQPLANTFKM